MMTRPLFPFSEIARLTVQSLAVPTRYPTTMSVGESMQVWSKGTSANFPAKRGTVPGGSMGRLDDLGNAESIVSMLAASIPTDDYKLKRWYWARTAPGGAPMATPGERQMEGIDR